MYKIIKLTDVCTLMVNTKDVENIPDGHYTSSYTLNLAHYGLTNKKFVTCPKDSCVSVVSQERDYIEMVKNFIAESSTLAQSSVAYCDLTNQLSENNRYLVILQRNKISMYTKYVTATDLVYYSSGTCYAEDMQGKLTRENLESKKTQIFRV